MNLMGPAALGPFYRHLLQLQASPCAPAPASGEQMPEIGNSNISPAYGRWFP